MRRAMANARVGDDVFKEDPTVRHLQERAAEIFEREASLFVPSGTMGNQIAVRLHTRPGQEVIVEARGHIYNWEMAAMSSLAGCLPRPISAPLGRLTWDLIEPVLSPDVYYRAQTGLIVLENTHNMAGGTVLSAEDTSNVVERAHDRTIPVHLDGARIFNAAVALDQPVAKLSRGCDSVMFCLSKGLAAPIGSILLGEHAFISEAWRVRKMLGGGMRQVGILAAAGLVSLESMPERLHEDHANARRLAQGLAESKLFEINLKTVQTNIVIANVVQRESASIVAQLRQAGILAVSTGLRQIRFVTHKDVASEDIDHTLAVIHKLGADQPT